VKQFVLDFSAFIFGLVGASFTLGLAVSGAFDWSAECLVLAVCCCFATIASIAVLAIEQGGYAKHDRPERGRNSRVMQSQPADEKKPVDFPVHGVSHGDGE
jgi:hypothetical protein